MGVYAPLAENRKIRETEKLGRRVILILYSSGYFSSNYMTKIPEVLVGTSDEMGEIKDTITITEDDRIIKHLNGI